MKKLITLALLLTLYSTSQAQSLKSLFNKYSKDERFEYVSVGQGVLALANIFENKNEEFTDIFSKIRGIKILSLTDGFDDRLQKIVLRDLDLVLENSSFNPVLEVREKDEKVSIHIQTGEKDEVDMLVINKDPVTLSLIWINGKVKPEELISLLNKE